MQLRPHLFNLAAISCSLLLGATAVQADVFDWNNITYAPTSAQATDAAGISIGNSANGNNSAKLFFKLSSNTANSAPTFAAITGVNYPSSSSYSQNINYYVSGGGADAQKALQIGANFSGTTATVTQSMLVTILFAQPVVSVSFSFFDVDTNATGAAAYIDKISAVQGSLNGGAAVTPAVSNVGSTTTTVSGNTITASATNAQNSAGGNALVTFNSSTPINQFSFVYGNNYTTGGGGTVQIIGLSNITFTTVPEPGTVAMMGLGLAGATGVALRRRR